MSLFRISDVLYLYTKLAQAAFVFMRSPTHPALLSARFMKIRLLRSNTAGKVGLSVVKNCACRLFFMLKVFSGPRFPTRWEIITNFLSETRRSANFKTNLETFRFQVFWHPAIRNGGCLQASRTAHELYIARADPFGS